MMIRKPQGIVQWESPFMVIILPILGHLHKKQQLIPEGMGGADKTWERPAPKWR